MAWLAPLWLAAVAAVAIPLLIHLRRRRVGRRIRVGSLRHLAGIAMPRRRRLQLRDPWLFALRGLIVALPAVALAEPVITRHDAAARWALVSPELVLESAARPVLDSLRSAGASVRLLAPGFPEADGMAPTPPVAPPPTDLWSLLRDADGQLPPGSRITLVVRPRLALARGSRPAIGTSVTLRAVTAGDTGPRVAGAWTSRGAESRLIETPVGGGVRRSIVTAPEQADGGAVDTDSISVHIVADSLRLPSARYVAAAFRAAAEATHASAGITTMEPDAFRAAEVGPRDWTVWLSDAPLPRLQGIIVTEGSGGLTSPGNPSRPTLHFASRLDPAGGLLPSAAFADLVARRWVEWSLAPGPSASGGAAISAAQLLPRTGPRTVPPDRTSPLRQLVLGLAVLLFLGERWLAFRRP